MDPQRAVAKRVQQHPAVLPLDGETDSPNNHCELLKVLIMFDGGSRGNPGSAGAGAIVTISSRDKQSQPSTTTVAVTKAKKIRVRHYLGRATNNEAEYSGLCKGLEATLQELKEFRRANKSIPRLEVHLVVQGDSQLIIKQLTKEYRCKHPGLQVYLAQARRLVDEISKICVLKIDYQHVLRAYNSVADGESLPRLQHYYYLYPLLF